MNCYTDVNIGLGYVLNCPLFMLKLLSFASYYDLDLWAQVQTFKLFFFGMGLQLFFQLYKRGFALWTGAHVIIVVNHQLAYQVLLHKCVGPKRPIQ